jgi:carbohydrate kinase (thermoresistant glucokinase family)
MSINPNASILLIMGVSSSGKTTIGELLSKHFSWPFFDSDGFHPEANVEKMRRGVPLTDEDRVPWLHAVRERIDAQVEANQSAIFACSALKSWYREILIDGVPGLKLIHLVGSRDEIRQRAEQRVHQYMPASLVDSQFETLEHPQNAISVSVSGEVSDTLKAILSKLT